MLRYGPTIIGTVGVSFLFWPVVLRIAVGGHQLLDGRVGPIPYLAHVPLPA